jgi:hypothetical protein
MTLSASDLAEANGVLSVLMQDKYKNKMYLFLSPINLAEVPGYFDSVPHKKCLDIQTVTNTLEIYETMDEFWVEAQGIFENAIAYHQNKETKWIAKMAKDMLKVLQREKLKRQQIAMSTVEQQVAGDQPEGKQKKKISLKLKLPTRVGGGAAVASNMDTAAGGEEEEETVVLADMEMQEEYSMPIPAPPVKSEDKKVIKAKSTQPKLKLKLSLSNKLKKDEAVMNSTPTVATTTAAASTTPDPAAPETNKTKISLNLGSLGSNSRGKELPSGVVVNSATGVSAPPQPKKAKQKKVSSATSLSASVSVPSVKLSNKKNKYGSLPASQSLKVIAGLRRRQNKSIAWFLQPVSDKAILADYKAKIRYPSDISSVTAKIEKGSYSSIANMVLDLRRIFGNCLIYNTSIKDSLRPVAVEVMETSEELLKVYFKDYPGSYPPLLYCWKLCVGVLDTLYNLVNPDDGQPTALYFLHPVSYYCGGQFPPDYNEKVNRPMDFGTVTSKLMEGKYSSVDDFCSDCRLVLTNCINYYKDRPDGIMYIEQAKRLNNVLSQQVEQLSRYVKSSRGSADQQKANASIQLAQPPVPLLVSIIQELRMINYTDKATKISEPVMGPFEKPVSVAAFPDYTQHVSEPMDLSSVEKKAKAGLYLTPEDFEYDVNVIFKNCEKYNSARGGDHLVNMSKYGARQFRKLFYAKMRAFEDPSSVQQVMEESREITFTRADPSTAASPSPKMIKIDTGNINRGKAGPRISITAAQVSVAARAKSPSQPQRKNNSLPIAKPDQPVPLHIAIARVKEAFPLRRQIKSLQPWEADCAKLFKELMRHPWISAARPKFIFHVPVPVLFPELREAYAVKVRKPMDLTTVECTLLAGNRYAAPEDFISDVALVFANAVRFNRDGKDIGDPLSCAYYDASVHLLRYARWLSMELLALYIDNSELVDQDSADGLPPFSWKLTEGNKRRAREEMEKLVLSEPIERSLEGDRYTWPESECEKLLKSLRHQSDLRYMTFFIQPNYPPDYAAYIAKPMDWERVNRTLKKRHYDKFGDIVSDLRLIFSNALKYNGRLKGTDTVSGRAYEAANIMSAKLESAIVKLLLSVADRTERERIDHANAEREIEAEDRAEEARIRAAWKKEPDGSTEPNAPSSSSGATMPSHQVDVASQKIRLVRRAAQRRESTDFEIPFFDDEDDGQHERSHFEVVKFQKAMFQKLQQEQIKMRQRTSTIGSLVYARMLQRDLALEWEENELKKAGVVQESKSKPEDGDDCNNVKESNSNVLQELEREGRGPLQIRLGGASRAKKRKHTTALLLE